MPSDMTLGGIGNWGCGSPGQEHPSAHATSAAKLALLSQTWMGRRGPGRWRGTWGPRRRREGGCRVLLGWLSATSVLLHRGIQAPKRRTDREGPGWGGGTVQLPKIPRLTRFGAREGAWEGSSRRTVPRAGSGELVLASPSLPAAQGSVVSPRGHHRSPAPHRPLRAPELGRGGSPLWGLLARVAEAKLKVWPVVCVLC